MGNDLPKLMYINNIGGWNGEVEVKRASATTDTIAGLSITIGEPTSTIGADRPIITLASDISGTPAIDAYHGNALDASGFTQELDVAGEQPSGGEPSSIAVDANGKLTVAYVNTSADLKVVEHLASSAWTAWETPVVVDSTNNPNS